MLYKIEEYVKEYPQRPLQALEKFRYCSKNLHEMSLKDINELVSTWNPLDEGTALNQKKQIVYYFRWLKENGINVNTEMPYDIQIPLSTKKYLIYSTNDLAKYYNILFNYLERQATITGGSFNKDSYYMCYAAGILAFYGLTEEQILELDLSDIQNTGVNGYDIPLSKHDIYILLSYKNLSRMANNMPLYGSKYIRSTRKNGESIDKAYLSRPIWRITFEKEYAYLKNLLRVSNLYWLGVYNRIYEYETTNFSNECIQINKTTPDWFVDFIGEVSKAQLVSRKKEYMEYRLERQANVQDNGQDIVQEIVQDDNANENNNIEFTKLNSQKEINLTTTTYCKAFAFQENIKETLLKELHNTLNEIDSVKNKVTTLIQVIENELS